MEIIFELHRVAMNIINDITTSHRVTHPSTSTVLGFKGEVDNVSTVSSLLSPPLEHSLFSSLRAGSLAKPAT